MIHFICDSLCESSSCCHKNWYHNKSPPTTSFSHPGLPHPEKYPPYQHHPSSVASCFVSYTDTGPRSDAARSPVAKCGSLNYFYISQLVRCGMVVCDVLHHLYLSSQHLVQQDHWLLLTNLCHPSLA